MDELDSILAIVGSRQDDFFVYAQPVHHPDEIVICRWRNGEWRKVFHNSIATMRGRTSDGKGGLWMCLDRTQLMHFRKDGSVERYTNQLIEQSDFLDMALFRDNGVALLGLETGLVQFNGTEFLHLLPDWVSGISKHPKFPSVLTPEFFCLEADSSDACWLSGSEGRLRRVQEGRWQEWQVGEKTEIWTAMLLIDGPPVTIFLGSNHGLLMKGVWTEEGGFQYRLIGQPCRHRFYDFTVASDGTVYAIGDRLLVKLLDDSVEEINLGELTLQSATCCSGGFLIGTEDGVYVGPPWRKYPKIQLKLGKWDK